MKNISVPEETFQQVVNYFEAMEEVKIFLSLHSATVAHNQLEQEKLQAVVARKAAKEEKTAKKTTKKKSN